MLLPSFLSWNSSSLEFHRWSGGSTAPSPFSPPSLNGVNAATPSSNDNPSPHEAQSPLVRLQNKAQALKRAHMFVEGRFTDLLKSLEQDEVKFVLT